MRHAADRPAIGARKGQHGRLQLALRRLNLDADPSPVAPFHHQPGQHRRRHDQHAIVHVVLDRFRDNAALSGRRGNRRVMCLSLHPHNIGRPNAANHLDEALRYILGHDGVWNTTADDIAEYYLASYYNQVSTWIAKRKSLA